MLTKSIVTGQEIQKNTHSQALYPWQGSFKVSFVSFFVLFVCLFGFSQKRKYYQFTPLLLTIHHEILNGF